LPSDVFEVLEVALLKHPQTVRSTCLGFGARGMFFKITPFSMRTLLNTLVLDGGAGTHLSTLLAQWRRRRNHDQPFESFDSDIIDVEAVDTAMALIVPHAMLIASGQWPHFAIPVAGGRVGAGLGLNLVRHWLRPFIGQPNLRSPGQGDEVKLSPDMLQDVADVLRLALTGIIDGGHTRSCISDLQCIRDQMMRSQVFVGRQVYNIHFLVNCLLMSGLLSNSASLRAALRTSLNISIPDVAVRTYYAEFMRDFTHIPTASTLYRHRLTLTLAYYRFCAQRHSACLASAGGAVRWGTVDSSPQGRYDWVAAGFVTIAASDIVSLLFDANTLIRQCKAGHDLINDPAHNAILKRLTNALRWVQSAPAGVGSGRCSLAAKVHSIVHATRLMCNTWQDSACLMNSCFSWTGDLGTESLIPSFKSHLGSMFGDWVYTDDDVMSPPIVDEGFKFEVEMEAALPFPSTSPHFGPYVLDFSASIFIPGVLHVLHNITEGLADSLQGWGNFVRMLTHITRLLGREWSRTRLLATCFADWPHRLWQHLFKSFDAMAYEGRWASVIFAAARLLPLKGPLCCAWDIGKFSFGAAVAEGPVEEGRVRLAVVDEAIKSSWFWGYLEMIDCVAECLQEVGTWAESCPCHGNDPSLAGPSRHLRVRFFGDRTGLQTCPMRTRRAPEMANNAVLRCLRQLLAIAAPSLLLMPCIAATSPIDRNAILFDFGRAKRHILLFSK
jgi:hypothetical protein